MYTDLYASDLPRALRAMAESKAMQRLALVGMHCGCEYTAYPVYARAAAPYSRLTHSRGVAAIVWHFTHAVDFLNGDHLRQESTEDRTRAMIAASDELMAILAENGLSLDAVADYHRYPIADNDSPRLSADRLEYTLGNAHLVFRCPEETIKAIYDDLFIGENEDGESELCFAHAPQADTFTRLALQQSRWFVSDEDRFSMQALADLLHEAQRRGVLTMDDLYTDENLVVARLLSDPISAAYWRDYQRIRGTKSGKTRPENVYAVKVRAKKRSIDPLVQTKEGLKRFTAIRTDYAARLAAFRADDFDRWVWASFG